MANNKNLLHENAQNKIKWAPVTLKNTLLTFQAFGAQQLRKRIEAFMFQKQKCWCKIKLFIG